MKTKAKPAAKTSELPILLSEIDVHIAAEAAWLFREYAARQRLNQDVARGKIAQRKLDGVFKSQPEEDGVDGHLLDEIDTYATHADRCEIAARLFDEIKRVLTPSKGQ